MPQPTKGPRLGGSPAHQKLMLANLATSLFTHGKIHTTRAKAERLRPYAERLITKARRGDLHNRREIAQVIRDKDVVHRLMAEIGPFFADRQGGYTRITKTLPRKGDNAQMAIIELVTERTASAEAGQATRVAANRGSSTGASAASTGSSAAGSSATGSSTAVGGAATGAAATAASIAAAESDTDSTEATASESSDAPAENEVPEPMADNAAAAAGLDTDSSGSSGTSSADASGDDDDTVTDLVTEPEDKS